MIIGLVGKAKSGKDTVADYLVQNFDFKKVAFADDLKRLCVDMFNLTDEQVNTQEGKATIDTRYNLTPRELLQMVGTDWFRSVYPMIWVDRLATKLRAAGPNDNYVVTDIRFANEMAVIQQLGGYNVKLIRLDGGGAGEFGNHPSETALDNILDVNFDCIIRAGTGELGKLFDRITVFYKNKLL